MKRWMARSPSSTSHSSSSCGGVLGRAALAAADAALVEEGLGEQAGLDGLAELDLGDRVEQGSARDLVEVQPDAVASLDLARVAVRLVATCVRIPSYGAKDCTHR